MQNMDLDPSSTIEQNTQVETVEPFAARQKIFQFKFHGNATEYFGIWIVNIMLTVLTLTLYAPWAKVRRLRYFYRNSEFMQRRFDFTGLAKKIFIGRVIALSGYVLVSYLSNYSVTASLIGFAILYLALPWLIRSTLTFRARNSKWGNSRLSFKGTTKEAYWVFFLCILINLFTFGLFFPVLFWLYKRYSFDHLRIGQFRFQLKAEWGTFMSAMYMPIFLFIGFLFGSAIFLSLAGFSGSNLKQLFVMLGVAYVVGLFLIWPLMSARLFIATWNNVSVSRSYFMTSANQWFYAWIMLSNWIMKILSLGLLTPWAAIRLYRYQLDSLSLYLRNDIDAIESLQQDDPNAIAEEITDFFDFDVSL
jgi:uncharacterized membrane protein YjgN (DUF898 family)